MKIAESGWLWLWGGWVGGQNQNEHIYYCVIVVDTPETRLDENQGTLRGGLKSPKLHPETPIKLRDWRQRNVEITILTKLRLDYRGISVFYTKHICLNTVCTRRPIKSFQLITSDYNDKFYLPIGENKILVHNKYVYSSRKQNVFAPYSQTSRMKERHIKDEKLIRQFL